MPARTMAAPERSPTPQSILLVRLGAVGDVIRTLPLLQALARQHPNVRIGWATEPPSAGLLREMEALDRVHVLPRRDLANDLRRPWRWGRALTTLRRYRRELREARYDVVLDVHGTLKAALVSRLAGSEVHGLLGPGGSKEGASALHHRSHPFPAEPMTRIERALFLGRRAGLLDDDAPTGEPEDASVDFGLRFPAGRFDGVELGIGDPEPTVVSFPFASRRGQFKRWPLRHHVELLQALATRGIRAVLAWGSEAERREALAATREAGADDVTLAPPTDLVELSELLRQADLLVTGDTGPMHLAAAVGTPVLALFGDSDPFINRPWGTGHRVVVHSPLEDLSVERVLEAVVDQLPSERRVTEP